MRHTCCGLCSPQYKDPQSFFSPSNLLFNAKYEINERTEYYGRRVWKLLRGWNSKPCIQGTWSHGVSWPQVDERS